MSRPVFFDVTGDRQRWSARVFLIALIFLLVVAAGFAITLVEVPRPGPLPIANGHGALQAIESKFTGPHRKAEHWQVGTRHPGKVAAHPLTIGFYVPWDDESRASLSRHIGQLDWVVPGLFSVTGNDHRVTNFPDPRLDALLAHAAHRPAMVPMVQNVLDGVWDGTGTARLLADPKARTRLLDQLEPQLALRNPSGVMFDFESLPTSAQANYLRFLGEARQRFARRGWKVSVSVPVDDPSWNLSAYARAADYLVLMAYDEHTTDAEAGPIASQPWFAQRLNAALKAIPPGQAIVGIGNYSYDWTGVGKGDTGSVEDAWLAAHDSEAAIVFDQNSGNPTFSYAEDGQKHTVWFLDAASAWNQLRTVNQNNVAGVALWRLGTEDPGIWPVLASYESGKLPDLSTLQAQSTVDVEDNGEILRIEHSPVKGRRSLAQDSNGLIVDEQYHVLPTPYVIRRTGYQKGMVALTFDDGPDPVWTPKILDVLKAKRAVGTFFVIGENAVAHPLLLRRIVAEGSELGNHTFTHPNLANVSEEGTRLELDSTRRLVEAYTGRSLRLFRAPYFGDAEPTTADEIGPALIAQSLGYTNVGLHADPDDWKRPGTDAIVRETLAQVRTDNPETANQIILLHDGGGDRSQTLAALPAIIDGLRAKGYQIVPVSRLVGLSREQVMPKVTGSDLAAVRVDAGVFLLAGMLGYALQWLFFAVLIFGIGRALMLAALAWQSARPANAPAAPEIDPGRFVSVLIPAFNEALVIESSVQRVLQSTSVQIEVIVIDDGSSDGTSEVVTRAFGDHPQVRLLTLENGGKARALNQGLELARGEIIIALDADTQFEPMTIARLARWFADPGIGAVAGNAKVGNRINLVTRWQAVEYVTAQNLERRALARFDAIMVVPGAVGAWRRVALDEQGGYPEDTLAEDQDLTIAIQRRGWRVAYDVDAVAWTEAPETFRALAKQRFRWAFGTLQCLWKHRAIVRTGKPQGLALVGIPQAWLFQIGFALVSPIIDLALVASIAGTALSIREHGWAQTNSDVGLLAAFWLGFLAIDVACGWLAYRLERREQRFPAFLLIAQRFIYRQLMYSVVIRAVLNALRGSWVGWGKLQRTGSVGTAEKMSNP